ncbi:MAG: hypothetical protein F2652_01530 [Actinobacteria bacterium]|uniref:Unannotated protein n=1 Tax=freshwater metagenome TaxID=449393 RepID=A0A6J6M4M7_9ZZZZ|nr:hypothetical protein [Actinomycetota bacterium]
MEPLELISTAPKRRRTALPVALQAPIARVLVDTGVVHLDRPFDYLVPAKWEAIALPGILVRVPFSGRLCDGVIIERGEASLRQSLKAISSVTSPIPILTAELLKLIEQCREYYVGTFWDLFRSAVPPRHARGEKDALTYQGTVSEGLAPAPLPARVESFVAAAVAGKAPHALLLNQQGESHRHTISDAISEMVRRQLKVLLIYPDQRDVEIAEELFSMRGIQSNILHSGLSPQRRYRNYLISERADLPLTIGTRGALFARGSYDVIVLVDEEDHAYQEPRSPGWSASGISNIRSMGIGLLIYAPTVPLARLSEIDSGEMHVLNSDIPRPRVHTDGSGIRIPTAAWGAMRKGLKSGPVLVTVARKGHTPGLLCHSCRNRALCACGGPLVLASIQSLPSCALCEKTTVEWRCGECQDQRLRPLGIGSERTVEELGKAFPGIPVQSSTADRRIEEIDDSPRIVVATSGCEPNVAHGYAAVILLDGEFLAARGELDAIQDLRRRWKYSVSLLMDDGEVFASLPDVHPVVRSLVVPNSLEVFHREMSERSELQLPPAVASAVMSPAPIAEVPPGVRVLGTADRAVLTCEWSLAPVLREYLRSERDAASLGKRKFSFRFAPYRIDERVQ